jgi:Putative zinc- or iron-chelating domain
MSEFRRRPQHRYEDPLSRVWISCAERVGFRIRRTPEVYASTDGNGTLFIGTDETLDPDDSLAQMILHELCHALVEGESGQRQTDWGLDNTSKRDTWREHACLRLQAYLAARVGLRDFFAPTTDFRPGFWDKLPADPFAAPAESGGRREPSCVAARLGAWRASLPRWEAPLADALAASAAIAAAVPRESTADSPDGSSTGSAAGAGRLTGAPPPAMPSLWSTVAPMPVMHPAGHAPLAAYHAGRRCRDCAWGFQQRHSQRCRQQLEIRLAADTPACTRWEPADTLECGSCGACCREAYHAVEIAPREAVLKHHPELVVVEGSRRKLRREGERCAALDGGTDPTAPYSCSIYPDRPRTCRDFTRGSAHCLDARRRVGLSL